MRPYQHAVNSAAAFGGKWSDYLPVHEFIDSTKAACSDMRHRMILHSNDFGVALARLAFPDREDVERVVAQHILEDVGQARTLSDWLGHCRRSQLPRIHPAALPIDPERIVASETAHFGFEHERQICQVWSLLSLPMSLAPAFGVDALCVICNSFGPSLIRRLVGLPIQINDSFFDPAFCAERMIYGIYHSIPPMIAIVYSLSSSHQGKMWT